MRKLMLIIVLVFGTAAFGETDAEYLDRCRAAMPDRISAAKKWVERATGLVVEAKRSRVDRKLDRATQRGNVWYYPTREERAEAVKRAEAGLSWRN